MTLPARYTLDRVPWGDCACCDSGKCAAHVEHPDRDPPSRPTTAALVEKIERLYIRTLEERVRGLHESCTGLVKQNERQYDEVVRLTGELDAAFVKGAEAMRQALLQRVDWHGSVADRIRDEPVPERES